MAKLTTAPAAHDRDPLWYKKAIIYQAHVRSFCDSDADGIGDFRGVASKLDYLQDLGVTALWLLPFYPSPLRDDGYDIADYYSINPSYGTLADFKAFLKEAHRRGLRVITELVINHTSDQHSWFQKSRRAKPGSRWRDFYVWSDTPDRYKEARIIFKDFEPSNWSWDPVANAYFWHRFYSHQPDLNFDHPEVHKELFKVLDFWLDLGVDGLRLDAIPYLYEREGTNCENLPETHAFLKKFRAHVDTNYGDRMLLAEANQWPEDSAAYFGQGKGDECHVAFHFPLMPRLFMAVRMEDRIPIVDILDQTPAIPETSQWAIFLRNHDELTLEMVTDEERDYMYRVYAQDARARINLGIRRRLAPLLGNDRKRMELLNALLMSIPGTPVIYYGDEIGMGDNIFLGDRNGVRTPMQWSSDKNAGFSRANPQSLYLPIILDPEYHYEAINVEAQQRNPHSLLWWMKRIITLRKRWPAFGTDTIEFLHPENRKILAFLRGTGEDRILVVCNLSRYVQPVELDLSAFQQMIPLELFGRTPFPTITDKPYLLTLGPHGFYWFSLVLRFAPETMVPGQSPPLAAEPKRLVVQQSWEEVLAGKPRTELENILQDYIQPRRWFAGKARDIKSISIQEAVPISTAGAKSFLVLFDVDYVQGDPESYLLPLGFATEEMLAKLQQEQPQLIIAPVRAAQSGVEGVIYDAIVHRDFALALLDAIGRKRVLKGKAGEAEGFATQAFKQIRGDLGVVLEPAAGRAEQSNSSILFADKFLLKCFRRVEHGRNPDLEISLFLAEQGYKNTPAVAGAIEYRRKNGPGSTLAILTEFVPNAKDAWELTLDALGRFYDRVGALPPEQSEAPAVQGHLLDGAAANEALPAQEILGTFQESVRLLGERTAQMHLALAADSDDKEFAPEPFTPFYQRALFQSMRNQAVQNLTLLRQKLPKLPEEVRADAEQVLRLQNDLIARLRVIADTRITGSRIRVHGDYHLGQVLDTGKDFFIIDFEGEPARPLSERRIKRTPIRDVAGMLRSFHYAAYAALFMQLDNGLINPDLSAHREKWAKFWTHSISVIFLRSYLEHARQGTFLPQSADEVKLLLDANLLHKAAYEVGYELNSRPAWLRIPLQGVLNLIAQPS